MLKKYVCVHVCVFSRLQSSWKTLESLFRGWYLGKTLNYLGHKADQQ
jgi:hypothetical protein